MSLGCGLIHSHNQHQSADYCSLHVLVSGAEVELLRRLILLAMGALYGAESLAVHAGRTTCMMSAVNAACSMLFMLEPKVTP